jgi:3-hydroxy-9,10-secoandrosta-1,3,5(10)-triene-9,17-dione monooxygenase reductase component
LPEISSEVYKNTLGHFASGVTIVSGIYKGKVHGFTCQSFSALSMDPPLVMLAVSKASVSWPPISKSRRMSISILAEDQGNLARQFAVSGVEKFKNVDFRLSDLGLPLIDGAQAYIECEIKRRISAGDHIVVIGEILNLVSTNSWSPLIYYRGKFGRYELVRDNG